MVKHGDRQSTIGSPALILFAHGARGAAWAEPLERLRAELQRRQPLARVEIAYLELQSPDLAQALDALAAGGARSIHVVPVFWSRGAHIERDLVAIVQEFLSRTRGVAVRTLPVLADLPGMNEFLVSTIWNLAVPSPEKAP
jgi:sirohydrochlorin cobaltochelatase